MPPLFKFWAPGDDFQVSAQFMNLLNECLQDYLRRKGQKAGSVKFQADPEVWVKNTSGSVDYDQYSIVKLGAKRIFPVDNFFYGKMVFEIAPPVAGEPFVVTRDPCPRNNTVVKSFPGGWALARVMLNDEEHEWADVVTGQYQFLSSAETGQARVLDRGEAATPPPATTLDGSIGPDDLTFDVVAEDGWNLSVGDFIVLIGGTEKALITSVDGVHWTAKQRGYDGTTKATHGAGASVAWVTGTVWALITWDLAGATPGPLKGVLDGTLPRRGSATMSIWTWDGTIRSITVTDGGSGYVTPPAVSITGGGGSGATATAVLTADVVTSITIDDAGSSYETPPTVTIAGGSGAAATATLSGDAVDTITVDDGGSGYQSAPDVIITGDGTGAAATATLSGDAVDSVTVDMGGSGYTGPPVITFEGGGSGATATADVEGDSGANITVYAWMLNDGQTVLSGTEVVAQWIGNRYYVTAAGCPVE